MKYKKLDINIPLVEQGITPSSVDVVVGVNAVHTARNLECTLHSLKQAIRPGGWLFIGEGSPPSLVSRWKPDIIFGLLDGWWNVNVTLDRPRAGFLTPSEWCKLLTNAGFESLHALPGESFFKPGPCYGGVVIGISPIEN
jgi:SAM-dependent methyltransferase